jgi:glucokinase
MAEDSLYLGVDLGGTKIAVGLWAGRGELLGKERWETLPEPRPNLERAVEAARALLERAGKTGEPARSLAAVGVSGGGPVDPERGVLLSVPNLPGWDEVPVCRLLGEALDAPCAMENDANACALAEWLYGAGRGARDLAFLTCSTGIGAGLILDGRLYRGSRHLAGEAGHQIIVPDGDPCGCGQRGCLETYASGAGMARRLAALRRERPGLPATAREVTERARAGDEFSLEFLRETARYLALGLANLAYILNPERFILGTIAVGAGGLLLEPLRAELRRLLWPALLEGLEVVPASLGDELGDRAALAVAERAGG